MIDPKLDKEIDNSLKKENAELKSKLSEYKLVEEEMLSYKLYVNARKQMIAWVSVVGVALSIFGYASINSLLSTSKEKVDTVIDEKIKTIAEEVAIAAKNKLRLVTDAQIAEMLEQELEDRVAKIVDGRTKSIIEDVDEKFNKQEAQINKLSDDVIYLRSERGDIATAITFINMTGEVVDIFWKDYNGQEKKYNSLESGGRYTQQTYVSHPWVIKRKKDQKIIDTVTAVTEHKTFEIK